MRFFLKKTQTLIGSLISIIHINITRKKTKYQWGKLQFTIRLAAIVLALSIFHCQFSIATVYAVVDPFSVPNNKFGIHIISPTPGESSPAAELVNTNGDWGYITVLIERKERKVDKWQEFFNDLRRRHLIPIVRLATEPEGDFWKRPYIGEEVDWANFLDSLNWPVKNRYVIVYNEPNHGQEWGGQADPADYAKTLEVTIDALKKENPDFFVLNAGFDASTPQQPPKYVDERTFLQEMNKAVPGIFDKLDGWASHSYPNPNFSGSPNVSGKGSVRTYQWEEQVLNALGSKKNLPIFITETGWKHAEGITYDPRLPSADTVAKYLKEAFETAWNDSRIVSVTPFLLDYQEPLFDHFSFKKMKADKVADILKQVLQPGVPASDSVYYPSFLTTKDMPKTVGKPVQEYKYQLVSGEVYRSLVSGETYNISLTVKNSGQSIWNDAEPVKLVTLRGGQELGMSSIEIPAQIKVEPAGEYTFNIRIKAPQQGSYKVLINLYHGSLTFNNPPTEFVTEVKSPVILVIKSSLLWKNNAAGDYLLRVAGAVGDTLQSVTIGSSGASKEIEARYLLPDYSFQFTLEKPFYKPSTVTQTVQPGVNILDFGTLQPNFLEALSEPKQIWKFLPFSN